MSESRLKLLVSNIFVYGLNQALVVLIPMLMLPIYSRLLPDISVYGIGSLATTISLLCSSFAIFGMFDAAVRFAFDKKDNQTHHQNEVCSTAMIFMLCTSIIVGCLLIFFRGTVSAVFYGYRTYETIVIISAGMSVMTVWNTASLIPIRISNKKKYALINSLSKATVTAVATLLLILSNHYLIAIPLGSFLGLFFSWTITFLMIGKNSFSFKWFNKGLLKEMLKYASPLLITFVSYWIYQSADKIMLSHLSNLTEVGIYAIGAKIGAVSGVIQTAFASGWAYFAFSTMDDDDQVQLISRIFKMGIMITCITAFLVIGFIYPVFRLMFNKDEYLLGSFLCAPLFSAPLFLTVMQVIGTQLLIEKNTAKYSLVQICGAGVNIVLNWILIPHFGSRGAALATFIGYIVPLLILVFYIGKKKRIRVDLITIITIIVTVVFVAYSTLFVNYWKVNMVIGCTGFVFCLVAFRTFLLFSSNRVLYQLKKKNRGV